MKMSNINNRQKLSSAPASFPQNKKYKNVKSVINTGASMTKLFNHVQELQKNYRFREDEIFKRMKITTLVSLLLQIEELNTQETHPSHQDVFESEAQCNPPSSPTSTVIAEEELNRIIRNNNVSPVLSHVSETEEKIVEDNNSNAPVRCRSTLHSVLTGIGELSIKPEGKPLASVEQFPEDMPYLILDVREKDEFEQCHLHTALNYPHTMLTRSANFETKEMLACKNREGTVIVIYDEDERIAPRVATTLIQRGYDNIFMLSGGLKVAAKLFPEGLMVGSVFNKQPAQNTNVSNNPSRLSNISVLSRPRNSPQLSNVRASSKIESGPSSTPKCLEPLTPPTPGQGDRPARRSQRAGFSEASRNALHKQLISASQSTLLKTGTERSRSANLGTCQLKAPHMTPYTRPR